MCITETYLVDPDHHNLTGLYYQAMHNCHADFLGKDLFDYQVDDDGDDCRVPKKSFSPFEPYRTHIWPRLDFILFYFMILGENGG